MKITQKEWEEGCAGFPDGCKAVKRELPVDNIVISRAVELLKMVYQVKEYQEKLSIANQGQCLDGYSALANYNSVADKIKTFLNEQGL